MWARVRSWFRAAFRRDRFEAGMDEELRFHIDRYAGDLERTGVPRAEAIRRARLEFGSLPSIKEDCRDSLGLRLLQQLSQDLRASLRSLRAGTSWIAIAMLALAIGLTTAAYGVLDALVLRPVPFKDADRLAIVEMRRGGWPTWTVSRAWKASGVFDAVGALMWGAALVETDNGPFVRSSATVTHGTLDLLGVRPLRGRTFSREDVADGGAVIISEDLWRRGFNADSAIIGRTIRHDGRPAIVVGVLPGTFRYPETDTELWIPMEDGWAGSGAWDHPLTVVRFRTDLPPEEALRRATEVAHGADRSTTGGVAVRTPLAEWRTDGYEDRVMRLLASGVGLVFLSLCVNVTGLSLARFNQCRRQFALCAALGASRRRLIARALTGSVVLSMIGTAAGVWLARALLGAARALLPLEFQPYRPLQVDMHLVAAAGAVAAAATLVTGLLPAVLATRIDIGSSLRSVERAASERKGARRLARSFVVAEIALACMLLVPTVLLIRSFLNLTAIDRGLDPRGLTAVFVDFSNTVAPDRDRRLPIVAAATDALEGLAGVEKVAWSVGLPTVEDEVLFGNWWPDMRWGSPVHLTARGISIGADFLQTYGIPLVRGRTFESADGPDAVVIDERIAKALWPGMDPVGRSFMVAERPRFPDRRTLRVIGVARNVHRQMLDRGRDLPTVYSRFEPGGLYASATLGCRIACPSEAEIRRQLISLSPGLRVNRVDTLEASFDASLAAPRMTATVAVMFAAIAVATAAGGLFSVLSHTVGRRRREFGIRSALGGSARAIGALVLRDAIVTAAIGLGIGAIAAWYLARALASVQFGVTIADPVSWATVIGVLALVTVVASWRPVRSAMRVDVALLLREE